MKTKILFKFLTLLMVITVLSCSKDDFQSTEGVCPEVSSTIPADGALNVPLNQVISATFNEVMNTSTITATSFTVSGFAPIQGSITFTNTATSTTAIFTPAVALLNNTTYTGRITSAVKDENGNAMQTDYVWSFSTGNTINPIVISTDPINGATNVALNKVVSATFNQTMNPATFTPTTFTLKNGVVNIPVTFSFTGNIVKFTPVSPLVINTTYTATITTGVKNIAGNSLLSNYVWSFTTGSSLAPRVISTDPFNTATNVSLNKIITATFSEPMNPLTITASTFSLMKGSTNVPVNFNYSGVIASFTPTVALSPNTLYTATIKIGVKNVNGVSIANNYVWSFTTQVINSGPVLGGIAAYGGFGGTAGVTNQGLNTVINNGGLGTTAVSTAVTGFHDGITGDVYTETPLNKGLVTGGIYTAPPPPGSATSFALAQQALLDATTLYNNTSAAAMPGGTDPGSGQLGGLTLPPGIYKSASGTFDITTGNLTLDAQGNPNAVWVFQTAAGLTVGIAGPTGARSVILINGATPSMVFWHVGSAATINGAGGGVMVGTILASSGVTLSTAGNAAQTVLNGRAISLLASVTMVNTTINVP